MNLTQQFIYDIRKFMRVNKMSPTTFGVKAVNDPHAAHRWINQRNAPKITTVDKVYAFMNSCAKKGETT